MDECLGEVFQTNGLRTSVTNDLSSVFVLCFGFVCVCVCDSKCRSVEMCVCVCVCVRMWVGGCVSACACVCECVSVYTRGDDGRIGYV